MERRGENDFVKLFPLGDQASVKKKVERERGCAFRDPFDEVNQ